ncbi:MAG: hypothetical protein ACR2NZ_03245 [Rubripirellula sp.]
MTAPRVNCLQNEFETIESPGNSDFASSDASDATWRLRKALLGVGRVYWILWMTAVGGLVAANLSGLAGMLFAEENKAESIRPWTQGGWCVGAILAFFGAITGKLHLQWSDRFFTDSSTPRMSDASDDVSSAFSHVAKNTSAAEAEHLGDSAVASLETSEPRSSFLDAVAFFGFIGGLVGALLGCSLPVFYFSLALSPLSPSWASSINVERQSPVSKAADQALVSRDSLVSSIVLLPTILGVSAGAILGGVGAYRGKITDG